MKNKHQNEINKNIKHIRDVINREKKINMIKTPT